MKSRSEKLAQRLAEKKAALLKKRLALEKATSRLTALRREKRMRCLVQYGLLFEQAGLLHGDENLLDREVVLGFLRAVKEGQLTAKEMERYRGQ